MREVSKLENSSDSQKGSEFLALAEDFNKYLLAEYQNIAEAHFKTIDAISSFFRYYLTIMALPITLFSAFIALSSKDRLIYPSGLAFGSICFVIALAGFFVLLYIVNLRMDAILYARTVNAIRKYFYDNSGINIETKLRMRVLPQTASQPEYFEIGYFLPVVISFALFNVFYLLMSMILFSSPLNDILSLDSWDWARKVSPLTWIFPIIFLFLHIASYKWFSHHREHAYLKSNAIGIDIDGVLNDHRSHFCSLLAENSGKQLEPQRITMIPVHEDPSSGVSLDDEKRVFNNPRYWVEMPCLEGVAHNIRRLRHALNLKIYIFSNRPWPSTEVLRAEHAYKEWENAALSMLEQSLIGARFACLRRTFNKVRLKIKVGRLGLRPIELITKCWLKMNEIEYDGMVIEEVHEDNSERRRKFQNRFYIARKGKFRFFVEDDDENANKLSYLCDTIFLVDHPYNKEKDLPSNVLRVKSWGEIYRLVKKYS